MENPPASGHDNTTEIPRKRKSLLSSSLSEVPIKYLLLGVGGLAALAVVVLAGIWFKQFLDDQRLVGSVRPTAQEIYAEMARAKTSGQKPVSRWQVHAHAVANAKNLNLLETDTDFKLCANFRTNQSGGAKLSSTLSASDLPHHPAGLACYKFAVTDEQSMVKDTEVDKDLMAVNIIRPNVGETSDGQTNISTYDLGPSNFEPNLNVASAQVVTKSGTSASLTDIKLGSTISAYYEMNILTGAQNVYKIVIEDSQVNPRFCEIVTSFQGYRIGPSPSCPITVNGLTVTQIDARGMVAKTSGLAEVQTYWTAGTMPAVVDSSGRALKIMDVDGAKVDLVMTGETVAQIHKE